MSKIACYHRDIDVQIVEWLDQTYRSFGIAVCIIGTIKCELVDYYPDDEIFCELGKLLGANTGVDLISELRAGSTSGGKISQKILRMSSFINEVDYVEREGTVACPFDYKCTTIFN